MLFCTLTYEFEVVLKQHNLKKIPKPVQFFSLWSMPPSVLLAEPIAEFCLSNLTEQPWHCLSRNKGQNLSILQDFIANLGQEVSQRL